MAPSPAAADGGMHMGGRGSRNMKNACYKDPLEAKCEDFERSDDGGWAGRGRKGQLWAAGQFSWAVSVGWPGSCGTGQRRIVAWPDCPAASFPVADIPPARTDWNDDLDQLCSAMPYMPGCSLRDQCEVGALGRACMRLHALQRCKRHAVLSPRACLITIS